MGYHAGKPIESVVYCLNILEKAGTSLSRGANSLQLIYTLPLNSKCINKGCFYFIAVKMPPRASLN